MTPLLANSALAVLAAAAQVQVVPAQSLHPSWCPAWAFWALSLLTIAGALVTITRRNLIGAVMSLVATFFALAGIYALLSAHFLAAIQVLVYAGAIMVLFVFVIMVLNREEEDPWSLRSPFAKAIGAGALAYLLVRLGEVMLGGQPPPINRGGIPPAEFGTVAGLGEYFFTRFLFPFEAVSILLVIAVIGAVVLARTTARPTSVHDLPPDAQPHGPQETTQRGDDGAAAEPAPGHGGH
jgi:NADH-quinone oxidoreductase subunit J